MTLAARRAERAMYSTRASLAYPRWRKWQKTKNLSKRQFWHDRWVTSQQKVTELDRIITAATRSATHVSAGAVRMIAQFEGGQSSDGLFHPYRDDVGVWTVGFGHTEGNPLSWHPLTKAQAEALLQRDLDRKYAPFVADAAKRYGLQLGQNQFDSLTSFAYNLGGGYFQRGHDIGDAMAARDYRRIAAAILLYDKAGGRALTGLTRRRHAERDLFLR